MALENKAQKLKRESLEGLAAIVAATQSEIGYMFAPKENAEWLFKNGLVEFDENVVNEAGYVASRATEKGIEKVMSENVNVEGAVEAAPVKAGFVIANIAVAKVARKGGGRGGTQYPFESLEVGQSFFVPSTEKRPDPVKSLASTITAANVRFAVPVFEEDGVTPKMRIVTNPKTKEQREVPATKATRKFNIGPCADGGVYAPEFAGVAGASLGRIQ